MPPPRESAIEDRAVSLVLDCFGIIGLKLNTRSGNGWPDRMFLMPGGKPFLVEFKRPGEDPEPLQEHRHEVLRRLGYDVAVHDTVDGVVSDIRERLGATRRSEGGDEVPAGPCGRHRRS